jgi:hypothetical protein
MIRKSCGTFAQRRRKPRDHRRSITTTVLVLLAVFFAMLSATNGAVRAAAGQGARGDQEAVARG